MADIVASPLGLWLVRAVYITPAADPAALLTPGRFPDTATLRAHLLDRLIGALIDTRLPSDDPTDLFRPRRRHHPAQVRRWLGYLADHLAHLPTGDGATGTRDFIWWNLAYAGSQGLGSGSRLGLWPGSRRGHGHDSHRASLISAYADEYSDPRAGSSAGSRSDSHSGLDDAHRLGLLRAVGPAYQFRHAELHDHLAATYR